MRWYGIEYKKKKKIYMTLHLRNGNRMWNKGKIKTEKSEKSFFSATAIKKVYVVGSSFSCLLHTNN